MRIKTNPSVLTDFDPMTSNKSTDKTPEPKQTHIKMGTGKHLRERIFANILGLKDSHSQVVKGPVAQSIVDAESLGQRTVIESENPANSLAQQQVGTLYTRISRDPTLYGNRDQVEDLFKNCPWVSVSTVEGCWICQSAHLRLKEVQRHSQATDRKSLFRMNE